MSNILLVDDRPENLLALEAILEPLGQTLVRANSGEEALRGLLDGDYAVILLDVQMPGLDGFETAALIKQRERTRNIPIIFLTAISKDEVHVFKGYQVGAVDYVFKPFDPDMLRSKVAVFIELWEKNEQLRAQAEQIKEQELAALRAASEERYRFLAESIPQQVWTALPDGGLDYLNRNVVDYFGVPEEQLLGWGWVQHLHPDDVAMCSARWEQSLGTGDPYEVEFRLRSVDGSFRWHLGRAVALRDDAGAIVKWFGTNTDIHDRKRSEQGQRFLIEAGAALGSSLEYPKTLASVAALAVPAIADWCVVDILGDDGELRQLAMTHADPKKIKFAKELQSRYPPDPAAETGAPHVIRTGEPELMGHIPDRVLEEAATDELHLRLLRELGLGSYMCVPLVARGSTLGAITFVAAESGRRFGPDDLALAEELARRAGTAIENAQLYAQVEERAQASRVLETIADGVFLVDREDVVRVWNPAAEAVTGLHAASVIGHKIGQAIPAWETVATLIPVGTGPTGTVMRAETVPLEIAGAELWLSIAGVGFDEGTVYAFRDLTEERAVEEMKSDFVATVSHELRTPLAAIYGAAVTIRRTDLELDDEMRDRLLEVIAEESDRLAQIVNDVLLASHLDSGQLHLRIEACDAVKLAHGVIEAAEIHRPESVTLSLDSPKKLPAVAADEQQLRQVLVNLVENAIKYSPDGGPVTMRLERQQRHVRFEVSDEGLGVPAAERRRIFEKFYRLDPHMSRGIGGTGLGLYICKELVRRIDGRIWVDSRNGKGSSFFVEIPLAEVPAKPKKAKQAA